MQRSAVRLTGRFVNPFKATLSTVPTSKLSFFQVRDINPQKFDELPISIRVLLESAARNCDGVDITPQDVERILNWKTVCDQQVEIPFKPARVLLQDFTGVPCVVDLASMRDAMVRLGGDPKVINPQIPVELVVDHSVQVDHNGTPQALEQNQRIEMQRNRERFAFLKWGSRAFHNLRIIPPGSGIVHQVNLEYLARVVFERDGVLYPDSVVGTDSHTTMINGLGVIGWGVGGIEAEAAMLGQSLSMVLPRVVGYRLTGKLREGATATDLVLTIVKHLRKHGVVGKFVEFYGDGLEGLSLADRATIANMAPEYGATMGYFPVDSQTLRYLHTTGRSPEHIRNTDEYVKTAGMQRSGAERIIFSEHLELDLAAVEPCVSGPKRPHDHVPLRSLKKDFLACMGSQQGFKGFAIPQDQQSKKVTLNWSNGETTSMQHGSVVIAAVTSCTNTSNPSVLIAAGLVAKKALQRGLTVRKGIKTSLSPGSHVVTEYLKASGLQSCLDQLGFHTTGYGCMTCIGNSGDIAPEVSKAIQDNNLVAAAVLSGNRNFEARIHPLTAANYLASPPLVIAFALAGRVDIDFENEPIANGVFLRDIWPTQAEIADVQNRFVSPELFSNVYRDIASMNPVWNELEAPQGERYPWENRSTYVQPLTYLERVEARLDPVAEIRGARCLLFLGDSVTTDHISPAGDIALNSSAGKYLLERGTTKLDFNTYGARRGNDAVMARGTFANVRLSNKLVGSGTTGPKTKFLPSGAVMPIYDAAMAYAKEGTPLVILAGKEYGSGSSRDWAAKGPQMLGVRVVLAESFERIHRSNLVGMGIVPLQFKQNTTAISLGLTGNETFAFDLRGTLKPGQDVTVTLENGKQFDVVLRIDTAMELQFFHHGGILAYVLRQLLADSKAQCAH